MSLIPLILQEDQAPRILRCPARRAQDIKNSALTIFLTPLTLYKLLMDFAFHSDHFSTKRKRDSEVLMSTTKLSMNKLKELGNKFQSKTGQRVPLILLAVSLFAGALRRFLTNGIQKEPCSSDKEISCWEFEKYTNFVMALPLGDAHPGDSRFCNHWTHGIFNVDMEEPNPVNRLLKLNQNFRSSLRNKWPTVYHFSILPFQALLPKGFWTRIIDFNMGAAIGSTNMIGPADRVFVGGREVMEKYAYVGLIWKHSSMTAGFVSYDGTLSATLVANRNVIPDQETADWIMSNYFREEIEELFLKIE